MNWPVFGVAKEASAIDLVDAEPEALVAGERRACLAGDERSDQGRIMVARGAAAGESR